MGYRSAWFVLLLLASGCAAASSIEAPARVRASIADPLACRLLAEREGECSGSSGSVRLAFPFAARAAVARDGGGAYVLGCDGELARFDAAGRITGMAATEFSELSRAPGYVCGANALGQVECARDHHHDHACPGAEMPGFFPVPLVAANGLQVRGREVCANDVHGVERCVRVRARCDTLCVAFPACSPLRCVDPCELAPEFSQPLAERSIFFIIRGPCDDVPG